MSSVTIAAVQAASVLMNQEATVAKAVELIAKAAAGGSRIVVFPEVFIPSTPVWVYNQPIWERDDAWYAMLVDQAVTVPGPVTDRLGAAAQDAGVYLVMGVNEREPHGTTIYNTVLYFGSDGALLGKHRKLMPTGPERTVWGMGDGSMLPVIDTPYGRLGGLICWENYMPLARFYLYASGVDIWVAPTLDATDSWVTTMRHIALEGRCYVVGVNPCVHIDQIPADKHSHHWLLDRGILYTCPQEDNDQWVEEGNSVIVDPTGTILAGPARHEETILTAEIDLSAVHAARWYFDPVGHYHRPDIFQLTVDTRSRPAVRTG
jgi:predicted amidohydrolase